jgi:hypothetical protein
VVQPASRTSATKTWGQLIAATNLSSAYNQLRARTAGFGYVVNGEPRSTLDIVKVLDAR